MFLRKSVLLMLLFVAAATWLKSGQLLRQTLLVVLEDSPPIFTLILGVVCFTAGMIVGRGALSPTMKETGQAIGLLMLSVALGVVGLHLMGAIF